LKDCERWSISGITKCTTLLLLLLLLLYNKIEYADILQASI
jgi:hypothetical protein